jgi:hypothetical protein
MTPDRAGDCADGQDSSRHLESESDPQPVLGRVGRQAEGAEVEVDQRLQADDDLHSEADDEKQGAHQLSNDGHGEEA